MVEKQKSYFETRREAIDKKVKGKTKDQQIKWLKHNLADAETMTRMTLDSWGSTLKSWAFWTRLGFLHYILAFLLGICWGIILFA